MELNNLEANKRRSNALKGRIKKPILGVNDLKTTHPITAKKWHPTLNGNLKPTDVSRGAIVECWWWHYHRETKSWHEWPATPNTMTNTNINYKCSICSNHRIKVGFNDMATTHPILAEMWHPTLNGDLTPQDVFGCTTHTHWWFHIDKNTGLVHEWPQSGNKMTRNDVVRPYGCLICSKVIIIAGINDLATTDPILAKTWHPNKNGALLPTQVASGTPRLAWWRHYHRKSKTWHEWPASIASRSAGRGCRYCRQGGFLSGKPGVLYLIQGEIQGNTVIQFGITNNIEQRLATHHKSGFINLPLSLLDFPVGSDAMALERELINLMREHGLRSCLSQGIIFPGSSEAFCLEDADQDFLDDLMELITL